MERNYTLLISELTKEDRETVEAHIYVLSRELKLCQSYVERYQEGDSTSVKLMGPLNALWDALRELAKAVGAAHKLPDYSENQNDRKG